MGSSSWPEYKLADLCESIDYGYTASAEEAPVGPKFLRITDIVGGYLDWRSVPYCNISPELVARYRLNHGDIVIARTGATTGFSAYVSNPPDTVFASYLVRLKIGDKANSRFIGYFLKTPDFWDYMLGVLGDKSAQPNASAKTMTQVKLRLPPLNEQCAIAHILGSLDDKIELNRRINETLEAMARALFKSWFIDFLPVRAKQRARTQTGDPGLPKEIADLFSDEFEDSELGEIPKGWRVGTLGNICKVQGGFAYKSEDFTSTGYPVIKIKNINEGRTVNVTDVQYIPKSIAESTKAFWLKDGDLLMAMTGATVGKFGLLVNNEKPCLLNQRVARFLPLADKDPLIWFVYCSLFIEETISQIISTADGSAQPNISAKGIMAAKLIVPPWQLISTFNKAVDAMFQRISKNQAESRTLTTTRDALLPKLISGELRVPDAEEFVEVQL